MVGDVAPVWGVEEEHISLVAWREPADIFGAEHVRRVGVQPPRALSSRSDSQKELPGLKSVASAKIAPSSARRRAGGRGRSRKSPQAGRSTAATALFASRMAASCCVASR